ncbi:hypothetical protein ACSVH3_11225, partial [Neisseria meningitidis]
QSVRLSPRTAARNKSTSMYPEICAGGCGFLPSNLTEFRKYCRKQYQKFKDDEVLVNRYAIDFLGAKKPPYDDRHVTSVKYWV